MRYWGCYWPPEIVKCHSFGTLPGGKIALTVADRRSKMVYGWVLGRY